MARTSVLPAMEFGTRDMSCTRWGRIMGERLEHEGMQLMSSSLNSTPVAEDP
jgi:hypothetical protein